MNAQSGWKAPSTWLVVVLSAVATLILGAGTFFLVRTVFISNASDALTGRTELENWADPIRGANEFAFVIAAIVTIVVFVVISLVTLLLTRRSGLRHKQL